MRPRIRKAVRAMRQAAREERWADSAAIGVTAYRIANAKERRVLETFLGPNAATMAGLRR